MLLIHSANLLTSTKVMPRPKYLKALTLIAGLWLAVPLGFAQSPAQSPKNQPTATPTPSGQNSAPEAGGPQGDIGPIAIPKKKEEEPKKEEAPKGPKKIEGLKENFSMRVTTQLVSVDVGVLSKEGMFIPGLKKENFRIVEDGVPQTISTFNQVQAPITAVMLVEFANNFYQFEYD